MKRIVLLGATGSIGQSTIKLVQDNPDKFKIVGASAHANFGHLKNLNLTHTLNTQQDLSETDIQEFIRKSEADIVLNAVTGFAGLKFTIATLKLGIPLALANKESLVAAGDIVMTFSQQHKAPIIPVDSEHSAIFQCLVQDPPSWIKRGLGGDTISPHPAKRGAPLNPKGANIEFKNYEKIFLTCSGGPFFGWTDLSNVSRDQALRHPNWDMGAKITVDSATLANKCLEFFEAMHLFEATKEQIQIVIHRESIIHSMVEFKDSSIIAQMSPPNMQLPIAYALNFPERANYKLPKVDFTKLQLNFSEPDKKTFKTLQILEHCAAQMDNFPIVFNATNEEARNAFIDGRISFHQIFDLLEEVIDNTKTQSVDSIEDIYEIDQKARTQLRQLL